MNYEELVQFRDDVAIPAMNRILRETQIRDGACYIDKLELSYLDGRNFGVECNFKALGLIYKDGNVQPFEHEVTDVEFCDFLQALREYSLITDGYVFIYDEMKELELKTTIRSIYDCSVLFPDVNLMRSLNYVSQNPEYIKMRHLFQQQQQHHTVDATIGASLPDQRYISIYDEACGLGKNTKFSLDDQIKSASSRVSDPQLSIDGNDRSSDTER